MNLSPTDTQRAVQSAREIYRDPDTEPEYEPAGPEECAAAVEALAQEFANAGGTVAKIITNSRNAGKTLSDDPLQGLSEIVQNANDAGATFVRFDLFDSELVALHDGDAVNLRDLHSLAAPWLTSKYNDPQAAGRFGIGLATLHTLADAFDLHSSDYHVSLGDPTLRNVAPYDLTTLGREVTDTLIRVPLVNHRVEGPEFFDWCARWSDTSLLFLESVREIRFVAGESSRTLRLDWEPAESYAAILAGSTATIDCQVASAADGRRWQLHRSKVQSPEGLRRAHKRTDEVTPLAVVLTIDETCHAHGELYAGLPVVTCPMPIRANAQFDPVTSRQGLTGSAWNLALAERVGDLWLAAMLHSFETVPATGWANVPLCVASNLDQANPLLRRLGDVLEDRTIKLAEQVRLPSHDALIALHEMAFEAQELTGLLIPDEITRLSDGRPSVQIAARDIEDRWRTVITSWLSMGVPMAREVTISEALSLIDETDRPFESILHLSAVAIKAGNAGELSGLKCVQDDAGERRRPTRGLPMLIDQRQGLAVDLGAGVVADDQLLLIDHESARVVLDWLRESGFVLIATDDEQIIRRLAEGGFAGERIPSPLTAGQLQAIRTAMEPLGVQAWNQLGAGVGLAITVEGFHFAGTKRAKVKVHISPSDAYLPRSLDSEPDSFAVAAAETPKICWIAPRYTKLLNSNIGRTGLGAQKFFRALGARSLPRFTAHPYPSKKKYGGSDKEGLPGWSAGFPRERFRALTDVGADFTLEDRVCPDLILVLHDISKERSARARRTRAKAVLGMLSRAWREIADEVEVEGVKAHHAWNHKATVRAFWVWEAATIGWLDDTGGQPTSPVQLRLRTAATTAVHGPEASGYLHPDLLGRRDEVLTTLGVEGEPNTNELIERLQQLRDSEPGDAIAPLAAVVYQAIANRVGSPQRLRLSNGQLRKIFAERDGLIHTPNGWRPPTGVFQGDPIFGDRREFVPPVAGCQSLWGVLGLRLPSLDDCIKVLYEVARSSPMLSTRDQGVVLNTLRWASSRLPEEGITPYRSRRLSKLPLWTSEGWRSLRPVFAATDPVLAAELGRHVPVWQPGGDVGQFEGLLGPLRVTPIGPEFATIEHRERGYEDEDLVLQFRAVVDHLKDDLARNAPSVFSSLTVSWPQVQNLQVWIQPGLRVVIDLGDAGKRTVPVPAIVDLASERIYLTDEDALSAGGGAGNALSALFRTSARTVSQAWLAASERERAGATAATIQLAEEHTKSGEANTQREIDRLGQLQSLVVERRPGSTTARRLGQSKSASQAPASSSTGRAPRELVDPGTLTVVDSQGKIVPGTSKPTQRPGNARKPPKTPLPPPASGGEKPHEKLGSRGYTEIQKETLGLDLARTVLASDDKRMIDLRRQHGVGADAVDELNQFFEFKVHAREEPDTVTLEPDQIRRAMTTSGFFLVVVSGLEGANASPQVRIIDDIDQLQMTKTSSVRFSGIHSARSLVFNLRSDVAEGSTPTSDPESDSE